MQNEETKKTKSARKFFVLAYVVLVATLIFAFLYLKGNSNNNAKVSQNQNSTLRIHNIEIDVIIARTFEEQQRGLCCRDSLPENSGMLFVYDQPGDYKFWMKNTRIPLDMYWINSKKRIVHIEHSVQPDSYPQTFSSPTATQFILETNAGFAKKHDIKPGNEVRF